MVLVSFDKWTAKEAPATMDSYSQVDSRESKEKVMEDINKIQANSRKIHKMTPETSQSKTSISLSSDSSATEEDPYESYSDSTYLPSPTDESDSFNDSGSDDEEKLSIDNRLLVTVKTSNISKKRKLNTEVNSLEWPCSNGKPITCCEYCRIFRNQILIFNSSEGTHDGRSKEKDNRNKKRSKKRKLHMSPNGKEKPSTSGVQSKTSESVENLLKSMNEKINDLSKSAAKLEQEIALCRKSQFASKQSVYTQNTPPVDYMGRGKRQFSTGDTNVIVPASTVLDATILNQILEDDQIFQDIVRFLLLVCVHELCIVILTSVSLYSWHT